ncbi:hypothetical protein JVX93_19330 [Mycolicibacterium boenickei]|nr:hypothetical protein JVX93_19330 [Mycolicibacterium boenickei]
MMSLLKRRTKDETSAADLETEPDADIEASDIDVAEDAEKQDDSDQTSSTSIGSKPIGAARRILVFVVLPLIAMAAVGVAAYFKYQAGVAHGSQTSSVDAVKIASDGTVALLSYHADSVEKDLSAAGDRLTGSFREDYDKLTKDVVIPGAHEKGISAVASVPAAATVSATSDHAVVLVFVDQNITVGSDPPTGTSSSVRVTLDKIGGRWMISGFEPV